MGTAHPLEHLVVVLQSAGAHASGEHDDVGLGDVLEGGVDGDTEHAVLAPDLAPRVTDEGDIDRGDALQDLVRSMPSRAVNLGKRGMATCRCRSRQCPFVCDDAKATTVEVGGHAESTLEDPAQRLGGAEATPTRDHVEGVVGVSSSRRAASTRTPPRTARGLADLGVNTRAKWRTLMAAAAARDGSRWSPPGAASTKVCTARTVERSARGTHTGQANWVWPPGRCRNITRWRATVWATSTPTSS